MAKRVPRHRAELGAGVLQPGVRSSGELCELPLAAGQIAFRADRKLFQASLAERRLSSLVSTSARARELSTRCRSWWVAHPPGYSRCLRTPHEASAAGCPVALASGVIDPLATDPLDRGHEPLEHSAIVMRCDEAAVNQHNQCLEEGRLRRRMFSCPAERRFRREREDRLWRPQASTQTLLSVHAPDHNTAGPSAHAYATRPTSTPGQCVISLPTTPTRRGLKRQPRSRTRMSCTRQIRMCRGS